MKTSVVSNSIFSSLLFVDTNDVLAIRGTENFSLFIEYCYLQYLRSRSSVTRIQVYTEFAQCKDSLPTVCQNSSPLSPCFWSGFQYQEPQEPRGVAVRGRSDCADPFHSHSLSVWEAPRPNKSLNRFLLTFLGVLLLVNQVFWTDARGSSVLRKAPQSELSGAAAWWAGVPLVLAQQPLLELIP